MNAAIQISRLEKSYGGRPVLRGLTFHVKRGEIFALLGVNGAGKTTALECIEGLRRPDAGTCIPRSPATTALSVPCPFPVARNDP